MIIATAETSTPAIDPTLLVLLSIFGGAALTVTAGFIGAWLQGRREHAKWLRERRYEAFVAVMTLAHGFQAAFVGRTAAIDQKDKDLLEHFNQNLKSMLDQFAAARAPLATLGPDEVVEASEDLLEALINQTNPATKDEIDALFTAFEKAVRKSLNIGR